MNKIEEIQNAEFLKDYSNEELETLASDIRTFLLDNISKTGGHLSSNLGIVDLTIALFKVFDIPKDIVLFDVGHEAYTYKILTGRAKEFKNLRQKGGLCGFQSLAESSYDFYETGHSGTSISSGIGFAIAQKLDNTNNNVISVIGDGSFSNGLAYEALIHLGDLQTKQIIILNDNQMSISENVGALHNLLDEIRSAKGYNNTKDMTKKTLKKTKVGTFCYKRLQNVKNSFKKLYLKKGAMFTDLGIEYYGPINGHDFKEMLKYLNIAKNENKPVILHVITQKGKGYKYAEEDTTGKYHGVGPFNKETGEIIAKTHLPSYSEIISSYVYNYARKDKDIICITPGMSKGSKLEVIKEKLPEQFIDVGICEEHALVMANTLALSGKKPIVFIYSTFLQRGVDALIHDIARCQSNVTICVDRAGIVPGDGSSHQGVFDIPLLGSIPGLIIASPKDAHEANDLIYTSLNTNKPFIIRFAKENIKYDYSVAKKVDIGSWEEVKKGEDGVIISYGSFINKALEIAENLEKAGKKISVVNARFIKPYDKKMWEDILKKNKPIFIYEESMKIGSLGSVLLEDEQLMNFKSKIKIIAIKDEFIGVGNREELIKDLNLDTSHVTEVIKKALK